MPVTVVCSTVLWKRSICENKDDDRKISTADAQRLVKKFDKDGDGKLSKEELDMIIADYKSNKER